MRRSSTLHVPLLILSLLTTHDCHIKGSIRIIIECLWNIRDRTSERRFTNLFFGKVSDLSTYKRPEHCWQHFQCRAYAFTLSQYWIGKHGSLTFFYQHTVLWLPSTIPNTPEEQKVKEGKRHLSNHSDIIVSLLYNLSIFFIIYCTQSMAK